MNNLSEINNAVYAVNGNPEYDSNIKYLLSLKPVLANILKGTAKEFVDMPIADIVKCIEGEPLVEEVSVEPGRTNLSRISGINTENNVPNEGEITYDIIFFVRYPDTDRKTSVKLIIDIEAQLDFYPGYEIVTRGIYYAARSISSQKTREFEHSDYKNIKKVYSIWICANPPKQYSNSIVEYSIKENVLLGNVQMKQTAYDLISVILIMLPEDGYTENTPTLPGMLKTILTPGQEEEFILNKLDTFYGIPRTEELKRRIDVMCNLSVGIMEKGIKEGMEKGIKLTKSVIRLDAEGYAVSDIATKLQISEEEVKRILEE